MVKGAARFWMHETAVDAMLKTDYEWGCGLWRNDDWSSVAKVGATDDQSEDREKMD